MWIDSKVKKSPKEVFHQTHTKEQSLVLSIVSALRWFLGWWIVSWKLESAALLQVAELSPRDQRGYWFVVAAASIVARPAAVQICSKFSKHLEGKICWWFLNGLKVWNSQKLQVSLSLCQPNHAYTERFLNCCMIDRCRYAHFEAFPAWAGFCMYFVWNFANFHNCNICIHHTIDLCWNLLGSGQFCQKGGNSKNLEQDLWAAGISSQVLSRRVGRMFFFFFLENWIIGDCKSQLEDPLMPILTVYLDDISHHSIVYSICTLYGWNLKGSNQAHMPLLS